MTHEENLATVVAMRVVEKPIADLRQEMREGFKTIQDAIEDRDRKTEEREKKLLDDLMQRLNPVLTAFKTAAVNEAGKNADSTIRRIFNVSPENDEAVESLQNTMRFIKQLHRSSRYIAIALISAIVGLASLSERGIDFLKDFLPLFSGGR